MDTTTNTPRKPRDTAKHRRFYRHALIKVTGAVAGLPILGYACGAATATTGEEPAPPSTTITQTTVQPLTPEAKENDQKEVQNHEIY